MVTRHMRDLIRFAEMQRDTDRTTPLIALQVRLLAGYDPTEDRCLLEPSMTIQPVVHPLFEAYMETSGATRRGRMTCSIGIGESYRAHPLRTALTKPHFGTVVPKSATYTRNGPLKIRGAHTREQQRLAAAGGAGGSPAGNDLGGLWNGHPFPHDAAAALSVDVGAGNMWFKVITHHLCAPEFLPNVKLNLAPAGRPYVDPTPHRPDEIAQIMEWAQSDGIEVVDESPDRAVAAVIRRASTSVIAVPERGKPAVAHVSVGAAVEAKTHGLYVGESNGHYATVLPSTTAAAGDVIRARITSTEVPFVIHPGISDIGAMALSEPYLGDDRLRDYQQQAVGLHQSTELGYLLAAAPGMGKTIIEYCGMRQRSLTRNRYRALVVCEPNVREQWVQEAATWFPEATVVPVKSRKDATELEQVLNTETGPVVAITSYSLAVDAGHEAEIRNAIDGLEEEFANFDAEVPFAPSNSQSHDPVEVTGQLSFFDTEGAVDGPDQDPQPVSGPAGEADDTNDEEVESVQLGAVLLDTHWHDIAADEAEVLRNTGSKQTRAMWHLRENSDVGVVLTGTPINKGIDDLGKLIAWARNDRFLFRGVKLSKQFDLADDSELHDMWTAMGPVIFRRDSSEISDELPDVTSTLIPLDPRPEETALSQAARKELKRVYDELVTWIDMVERTDPDNPEFQQAREGLKQARGAWLGGTTLARMSASDPAALLGSSSSGAALLAGQGLIEAATSQPGTKRTHVVSLVADRVANGKKVLVFTEFATVARGLIADLDAGGVRVGEVLGGGGAKRDRMITEFQNGDLDVLVCTASGERGLNLQQASVIVHYDLPWTPKSVIQRTGRMLRIGSDNRHVEVVFPLMKGTIEERVASLVVSRAVEAMRALDVTRGADLSATEMGVALGGLTGHSAGSGKPGSGKSNLMEMTEALVA